MTKQKKTMYEAWDDFFKAWRRLFAPVIEDIEKVVEKAARYLDD